MPKFISYTYMTDGSSDKILHFPIQWLLNKYCKFPTNGYWANPCVYKIKPEKLTEKILHTISYYPCDIIFIHRDAECMSHELRIDEIKLALKDIRNTPPVVCVVPVRMTEAWFLFDEHAIRQASGNPHGETQLNIPSYRQFESLIDPKERIYDLLKNANGSKGRHARKFKPQLALHRLAEIISDFSPLYSLPSFIYFKNELCNILKENRWYIDEF